MKKIASAMKKRMEGNKGQMINYDYTTIDKKSDMTSEQESKRQVGRGSDYRVSKDRMKQMSRYK